MKTLTNLTVGFYLQVLENEFPQLFFIQSLYFCNSFWINIFFTSFTSFTCSNLLSISSVNVLAFQSKNLILHNFSFNRKVAITAATTSFNHAKQMGTSSSIELFYKVTDALNLRWNFNGSYQSEYLLKMDSTGDFYGHPKASYLSGKRLKEKPIAFLITDACILKPAAWLSME